MKIRFEKEKYLEMMKTQGVPAALTALHQEIRDWEIESFEGTRGWDPEMFASLKEARDFSRQIWNTNFDQPKNP